MRRGTNPNSERPPGALALPGRRDLLKWLGVGGVGALAGCSSSDDGDGDGGGEASGETATTTATSGPTLGGTYAAATSTDAESLNWLSINDATSGSYIGRCLDGAWAIDPDQEIFPLWCDVDTDDGRVYEIAVRDGLRWGGDYGRMTADDWVYMIQRVFQAEDNWAAYANAGDWFRGDEPIPVEKTGTLTFEIRLPEVDPAFPYKPVMWGQNCMPKGLLEKYAPDGDLTGLKQDTEVQTLAYAGNLGPYSFESWQRDSRFVAVRNEEYYLGNDDDMPERWHGAPFFERAVFDVIKEESSRLGALEAGEVTTAGVPPNKAERFTRLPNVTVNVTPQPWVSVMAYNMRANGWAPFRKRAVRQALAHAVDKRAIADSIYRGYAQVAQTMQPRWSKWYSDDRITPYGTGEYYGPEVTRSKLEAALSDTEYAYDGDELVDGDGEQVTLSLYFDQGQPTEQTTAEFIAQEFRQNAGIRVTPKATSSFLSKFAANSPPEGEEVPWSVSQFNGGPRDVSVSQEAWDMSVNLGFNTYPYSPTSSKGFFETRGGSNFYGYVPERDIAGLYERASTTVDERERKEILGRVFGYINDEQPFGFVVMSSSISGYQSNVVGPIEDFASGWDYQAWYFQ